MRPAVPYFPAQALTQPATTPIETWPAYEPVSESDFRLLDYWFVVRKHFLLILGIFLGVEIITAVVLQIKTPLYTATSTILIEPETPEVLEIQRQRDQLDDMSSFYRTQNDILQSKRLAALVIRNLGLDKNPAFVGETRKRGVAEQSFLARMIAPFSGLGRRAFAMGHGDGRRGQELRHESYSTGVAPELVASYLNGLAIFHPSDARTMKIEYTHPNAPLAAQVVDAHVQAFVHMNYELHNENNRVARTYLEGELVKLENRLEQSEAALNQYRRERGIVTLAGDEDQTVAERMTALTKALIEAEENRIALQAEVKTIDGSNFDAVPEVVVSPLIQNLKQETSRLDALHASLSSQFTSDYPQVAQVQAQLDNTRGRLQIETRRVVDSVNAKYTAAQRREDQLRSEVENEKSRVMALKDASLKDAVLAREVEANRVLYKNILERIKTLGVASEAHVTNVSIIDAADVPRAPSSPKKKLSLVLSGFLALLVGVGAAFAMEGSDRGLKDAAEVQNYLRLPSLGAVVRFVISGPSTDANLPVRFSPNVLLNGELETRRRPGPDSLLIAAEAYRTIRTGILLSSADPPKTILFTSATMKEGKSVTAINTATAFASLVSRVLLIDADLRRPACHRVLEDSGGPGLTDVLCGLNALQEAVRTTRVPGLFLLSAGTASPNPTELLASAKMRSLIQALRLEYDHVVIDSAPVLPVSDSVILSNIVDGVVLVAARDTPRAAVGDAYSRLIYAGAHVLGAVLNRLDLEQHRYYSPYSYY